ncbi:hypothetical protein B0H10DRAFT_2289343, partial [Mycena sp. CBHHK59/15]
VPSTGLNFPQWSSSIHLVKGESGFYGSTKIPWNDQIAYKYVVDGNWVCEPTSPIETDASGNVNNVYIAPPKPVVETVKSAVLEANGTTDTASSENTTVTGEPVAQAGATLSQLASDFANTVAARDGTSSTLGYVTSALGAVIQSQIGVDPLNADKIAVETPKPDAQFTTPETAPESVSDTPPVSASEPSPVAPVVPISIVPVNAGENNTAVVADTPADAAMPMAATPDVPPAEVDTPTTGAETPAVPEPRPVDVPSTHTPLPTPIPFPKPMSTVAVPDVAAPSTEVSAAAEPIVESVPESKAVDVTEEPVIAPAPEPAAASIVAVPEPAPSAADAATTEPVVSAASVSHPDAPTPEPAAVSTVAVPEVVAAPEPAPDAIDAATAEPVVSAESVPHPDASTPEPATVSTVVVPEVVAVPEPAPSAADTATVESVVSAASAPQPEQPTNGTSVKAPTITTSPSPLVTTPAPSAPVTPAKNPQHAFPSSETESPSSSSKPASKFGTVGSRKNRKSIFGKIKGLFGNDKEKEK